jgi:hypothetical protein
MDKKGQKRDSGGQGKGAKIGAVEREVRFLVERATFPCKRVIFTFVNTPYTINIICICACRIVCLKKIFSPLQVKNKPRDGESEHAFILGSMVCTVVKNCHNGVDEKKNISTESLQG